MKNYLLRLGWSHGDDEIISEEQAIEWFDLDGLNKAPARLDFAKLDSVNKHYMAQADDQRLFDLLLQPAGGAGLSADGTGAHPRRHAGPEDARRQPGRSSPSRRDS